MTACSFSSLIFLRSTFESMRGMLEEEEEEPGEDFRRG